MICPTYNKFFETIANELRMKILYALRGKPMSVNELIKSSGSSRRTVYRALKRLSRIVDLSTGEIIEMVIKIEKKWYVNEVDLDQIAFLLGTAGKGRKQMDKHREERRLHRKSLIRGRKFK